MKHSRSFPGAGLLASAAVAALTLSACHRNAGTQAEASYPNGAYVGGSNNTSLPVRAAPAPPAGTYQAVARTPPPPIPVYDQPPMPEPGEVWTPGYWGWSDADDDYYWTPGTWVEPPEPDLYWTPGYWRYWDGDYLYSPGYWGPAVGFYGGIDYGWGYYGLGYAGGRWENGRFRYNRRANNFGRWRPEGAYDQPVRTTWNRASYNGGPGGLRTAPSQVEMQASRARHAPPTRAQVEQGRFARAEPQLRASFNHGAPPIAGVSRPGAFRGPGAVVTGARSPASWPPPQGRAQPGFAARPGPREDLHPAPAPGGPAAARRFEPAPHAAPFARGPAPAAPERAAPTGRAPEPHASFAGPRREAAPAFHAPPAPRPGAPAFRAAPARPERHAAPEIHRAPEPAFHPPPAQHPAPAFHAAPAPAFHAAPPAFHAPAPAPAFHAPPAPAAHAPPAPAFHPAPAPHPAAPAEHKPH